MKFLDKSWWSGIMYLQLRREMPMNKAQKIAKWLQDNPEIGYLNSGRYYVMLNAGCMKIIPELGDTRIWK